MRKEDKAKAMLKAASARLLKDRKGGQEMPGRDRAKKMLAVRANILFFLLICTFFLLGGRLYRIQVADADKYRRLAQRQHRRFEELPAARGEILTADGEVLASSLRVDSVFLDSRFVTEPRKTVASLAELLHLSDRHRTSIFKKLAQGRRFIWVKRKISPTTRNQLKRLGVRGVFFKNEWQRFYPERKFAAHILGFCDIDDRGIEGIELKFNKYLTGRPGEREFQLDARGRRIAIPGMKEIPARDGATLYLTVHSVIQHIVEERVSRAWARWEPDAITVIVMEPATGKIIALCNKPAFDCNNPTAVTADARRNRAVTDVYEPGSTFKPFTAAALLGEDLITLQTEVFCENGSCNIEGRRTLHDHKPHGTLLFLDVIVYSSNIGVAKSARLISKGKLESYIRKFGFGRKIGVELPGEVAGLLADADAWSSYSKTSISIGQEIGVTAMQMAAAFSALANGGILQKPLIVDKVVAPDGRKLFVGRPQPIRSVITEQTAAKLKKALVKVVAHGTGTLAKSRIYEIAGKTGTAQKLSESGRGYAENEYIASFIGFAPAEEPQLLVVAVFDSPHGHSHFGGTVAGPVVRYILEKSLKYLRVPAKRGEDDSNCNRDDNKKRKGSL